MPYPINTSTLLNFQCTRRCIKTRNSKGFHVTIIFDEVSRLLVTMKSILHAWRDSRRWTSCLEWHTPTLIYWHQYNNRKLGWRHQPKRRSLLLTQSNIERDFAFVTLTTMEVYKDILTNGLIVHNEQLKVRSQRTRVSGLSHKNLALALHSWPTIYLSSASPNEPTSYLQTHLWWTQHRGYRLWIEQRPRESMPSQVVSYTMP